jgi:hypothetical protein
LHEHVLSHPVVGADETTWRLMGRKAVTNTKRWQVWALSAPDADQRQLELPIDDDYFCRSLAG